MHGDHVEPQQILSGGGFLIRGQVDAADGRLPGGKTAQNAVPVAALRRVDVGDGAHQADLCRRACLPDSLSDACGKGRHGLAVHVQPDLPVGVHRARLQDAAHEFLARQLRLSGPAGVFAHMRRAEAAAPAQRIVVMQAEIVLHPQNVRRKRRVARVKPGKIGLPAFAHRADAQIGLPAVHVDHAAERLALRQRLAEVGVHQTVPVVDRQLHALRRKRGLHVAEQAQPDGFLLLLGHVAGIQLFYVTEHGHVIDLRLADEAPQRRDLAPVIEAGVAAEAEAVAIGLIHVTPQWADCRTKASAYAYSRMACTGRGWRARRRAARRNAPEAGQNKVSAYHCRFHSAHSAEVPAHPLPQRAEAPRPRQTD